MAKRGLRFWARWLILSAVLLVLLLVPARTWTSRNPIVGENQLPGTDAWRLGQPGFQIADDLNGQVQGYASSTSVNRGGQITLFVTVSPAQPVSIDVYRMGWYAGKRGRLVWSSGQLQGVEQPACPADPSSGAVVCDWTPTITLAIPEAWTTGVYVAMLTNSSGFQSQLVFTVRDDLHSGGLLFVQSVNTYQAYNEYPKDGITGKSLYDAASQGSETIAGSNRAVKVSFDRPYNQNAGTGLFFYWESDLIAFLERSGYDVSYITDVDLDVDGTRALRPRGVIMAGHAEYWTRSMYNTLFEARDFGVNLAFMGSDAGAWQIRYEPSPQGVPRRLVVCYRNATIDPVVSPDFETVMWRDPPLQRPEQRLIGVQFGALLHQNAPMIVINTDRWIYAGTGLRDGDVIAGVAGYEVDTVYLQDGFPEAQPGSYAMLSDSPVVDEGGQPARGSGSMYRAASGAWVFAAGTMSWSWALGTPGYYDPRLERATRNVFETFLAGAIARPVPPPPPATTVYPRAVVADRPLAYWRLGDTAGWHAVDATGNVRDGLLSGGFTRGAVGALEADPDSAMAVDGSAASLLPHLPAVTNFTIEGWTNLADPNWNADLNYNNTLYGSDGNVRLLIRPGASQPREAALGYFGVYLGGVDYFLSPPHGGLNNVGQWVHWALTREANNLSLYRNGALIDERHDLPPTMPARIDGRLFALEEGWNLRGAVDEVAVYDSALPPRRVQAHYAAAHPNAPQP